jgi:hypothetical protein
MQQSMFFTTHLTPKAATLNATTYHRFRQAKIQGISQAFRKAVLKHLSPGSI